MDDHRSAGINVKVYNPPRPGGLDYLTEAEANMLWERVTESFWLSLEGTLQNSNVCDKVYAEGRMGGWAVPDPAIAPGTLKWQEFAEIVNGEMDYYLNTVWPEAVREEAERLKAERERNDPYIEIKIRRSAAATIAGLVGTEDQIDNVVHFEDGDPRSAVSAADEAWEELRENFPVELFAEHGDWVGKDEE